MMNKNIFITIKKELRSIFRDKKTIMRMLLFPIVIPFIIVLYGEMYESMDSNEVSYNIGVNYEVSNEEMEFMKNSNLEVTKYDDFSSMEEAYEDKKIDGYLTYNSDEKEYKIYVDQSTTTGMNVASYASSYLDMYSNYLTNQYLASNGVDLEKAYDTFSVDYEELSSNNYLLAIIISLSVTYIIMAIVLATGNMATGATATEKENGTLETILTFPIKKNELIIGKYLSSAIIGIMSSIIAFVLMIVGIYFAKSHYSMFDATTFTLNAKMVIFCLLIIVVASLFIAGVAIMLCGLAKSYKEAQSSVSFLNFITIIPMFLNMMDISVSKAFYLVPIFNHEQIILDVFNGTMMMSNLLITIVSSIVYIVVIIWIVIKAYNSEKILFTN